MLEFIDKSEVKVINPPIIIDYYFTFFRIINNVFIFLQQGNFILLKVNIVLEYFFYLVKYSELNRHENKIANHQWNGSANIWK